MNAEERMDWIIKEAGKIFTQYRELHGYNFTLGDVYAEAERRWEEKQKNE